MLAEQHCVCTESGLKNVFSTRYVVGRQAGEGGEGKRTFLFPFLSKKMAGRNKNQQAPLVSSEHFSFLLRLLRALLSCCRFNPAVTVLGSQEHNQPQGPPSPNQRNACRNRCKGRFWPPSWHAPSWEGKRQGAQSMLRGVGTFPAATQKGKRGRGNLYSFYDDREAGDVVVCRVLAWYSRGPGFGPNTT